MLDVFGLVESYTQDGGFETCDPADSIKIVQKSQERLLGPDVSVDGSQRVTCYSVVEVMERAQSYVGSMQAS